MRTLAIVTAALPSRSKFLTEVGENIADAKRLASESGWRLSWHVTLDGPGNTPEVDPDRTTRLAARRGVCAARNAALTTVDSAWVTPLDADDLFHVTGLTALLGILEQVDPELGWVSANRLLLTGEHTAHWRSQEYRWEVGKLSEAWSSPFAFHPNSIVARTDLVWECGGWPALATNEDMGLCLLMSERRPGLSTTEVLSYYRVWESQEVSARSYLHDKIIAFDSIEHMVNAVRHINGRSDVIRPAPGPAFGKFATSQASMEDTELP
jgi:Glycosyl transferase family 2